MKLEILISTFNERVLHAASVLLPEQHPRVSYLVLHQIFDYEPDEQVQNCIEHLESRADTRIVASQSRGLSANRNAALKHSTGDVLLVSDDDATYSIDGLLALLGAFSNNSTSDIITFKISTPENTDYKTYSKSTYKHTRLSVLGVSSLEIAIRRQSLNGAELSFDERFGLGAEFPACEEAVLLANAISQGLEVTYSPIAIVIHPLESSGRSWSNDDSVRVRGAVFRQIYGILGFPLLIAFSIKQIPSYSHRYSFFKFLKLSTNSFFKFKP